jgi:hypothetical protein
MPASGNTIRPAWLVKLPIWVVAVYLFVNMPLVISSVFFNPPVWVDRLLINISPGSWWLSYETNNYFYAQINKWIFHNANYKWRYNGAIIFPAAIYGLIMYWLGSWLIVKGITFWQQRK